MQRYLSDLRLFSRDARLFLVAVTIFAFGTALPITYGALYFDALGFDRAFIGLTSTVVLVGGAVSLPLAMWLLDRLGRRRAMFLGLLMNWLFWGAAVSVSQGELILVLLTVSGVGNVLYGFTVVPLLAESSTPRERTALFASYEGLLTLALFLGSLVAAVVPSALAGVLDVAPDSAVAYRAALLSSFVFRAAGLIPLLKLSHRPVKQEGIDDVESVMSGDEPAPANTKVLRYLNPRELLKLRTPVLLFALPYALIFFAGSLVVPFLSLYLRADFAASDAAIGLTQGLVNLSGGIVVLLAPIAVGRVGRVWAVAGGCALVAAFTFGIGLLGTLPLVVAMIVLRAGLANAVIPVYRAFTIDRAPVAEYTIVSLLLQLSSNVGPAVAPPLSGLAQRTVDFSVLLLACAGLYVVSAALFAWVMRDRAGSKWTKGT